MAPDTAFPIRRALISVSDKTDLVEFVGVLAAAGIDILSTGGTASLLRQAGFTVTDVAAVTGFPEIMDGRVKTLHPKIHGGLLARRDRDTHLAAMASAGIEAIDLLVVNLYPFEETLAKTDNRQTLVEKIDIGGPAMLRAAAKNHDFLTVLCDPADYAEAADSIRQTGDPLIVQPDGFGLLESYVVPSQVTLVISDVLILVTSRMSSILNP